MSDITVQKVPKVEERVLPVFKETEEIMARIRQRAFDLCSRRGFGVGRALDDWLAAEREICWPAGELSERDKDFVLSVALAGFEPGDLSVTATPRELIVHARTRTERSDEAKKQQGEIQWSEFRTNDVYRRVELPKEISVDKVSASLKNGLLKIVAAKTGASTRAIPVAAAA
jgi:HSP20 family molecular chaperone IbpA